MIDLNALKKSANKARKKSPEHQFLAHEIAQRLAQRLPYMKIQPHDILDVGARDDFNQKLLQQAYPNAQIQTIAHGEALTKFSLPAQSVDMVFANLSLHWSADLFATLAECRRVLKNDGLLLFSTVGPDTLIELHQAFLTAEEKWHVHPFMDMHHIGDELLRLQFYEPVVDMEKITLQYEALEDLFFDLKYSGARNCWSERTRGLQGVKAWRNMLREYEKYKVDDVYPATIEVIYGQAWIVGPQLAKLNSENEAIFSLENGLPKKLKE